MLISVFERIIDPQDKNDGGNTDELASYNLNPFELYEYLTGWITDYGLEHVGCDGVIYGYAYEHPYDGTVTVPSLSLDIHGAAKIAQLERIVNKIYNKINK